MVCQTANLVGSSTPAARMLHAGKPLASREACWSLVLRQLSQLAWLLCMVEPGMGAWSQAGSRT